MINRHVAELSSTVAGSISASGYKAYPDVGSPLYDIVQANIGANFISGGALTLESIVTDALVKDAGDEVIHTEVLMETVDHVASVISGNIALVKTKVKPLFIELHKRFQNEMASIPTRVGIPVEIRPNVYHRIWGLQQARSMFEAYARLAPTPFSANRKFPELTAEQMVDRMKTGVSSIDEVLSTWLTDLPSGKITKVYKDFFCQQSDRGAVTVGKPVGHKHINADGYDRNDYLIAYLFAHSFLNDVPENTEGESSVLENYLVKFRQALGRVIYGVFLDRDDILNTKSLAYAYSKVKHPETGHAKHIINVNNDVLLDFYEKGGTPEIIFGAAVSNFGFSFEAMLADSEKLKKKWSHSLTAHSMMINSKMFEQKNIALKLALSRYVDELPDDELPGPRKEVHDRIKHLIGKLNESSYDEEEKLILNFTCDVFFPDTNAKLISSTMERVHDDNLDFTARECALYAVIEITAMWLASQIRCAKM